MWQIGGKSILFLPEKKQRIRVVELSSEERAVYQVLHESGKKQFQSLLNGGQVGRPDGNPSRTLLTQLRAGRSAVCICAGNSSASAAGVRPRAAGSAALPRCAPAASAGWSLSLAAADAGFQAAKDQRDEVKKLLTLLKVPCADRLPPFVHAKPNARCRMARRTTARSVRPVRGRDARLLFGLMAEACVRIAGGGEQRRHHTVRAHLLQGLHCAVARGTGRSARSATTRHDTSALDRASTRHARCARRTSARRRW